MIYMMGNKYYIPDISEFKQGFKFEKCIHKKGEKIYSVMCFDPDIPKKDFFAQEDEWVEQEVWWDREPSPDIKEIKWRDCIVYWKECEMDLMPNYSLETLLKNGRIRCKK